MSYTTDAKVRYRANLDSNTPGSTEVIDFIAKAETELGNLLGGDIGKATETTYEKNLVDFVALDGFKEILEVRVAKCRLEENSDFELLSNPYTEEVVDDDPEAWTDTASSGDTLTHDSTYSFIYTHSLKIEKGGSSASYWTSDAKAVSDTSRYRATCRAKVDANTASNTYLKLEFLDSDDTVKKTITSPAATLEITQPGSTTTTKAVSDSTSDTTQTVTIWGLVNGLLESETIELNGTSAVSGTKTFSEISCIKKSTTTGTVSIKDASDNTLTTMAATANEKNEWVELIVEGSPTGDSSSVRVKFYVDSATGSAYGDNFKLREKNWFMLSDGVHFTHPQNRGIEIDYLKSEVDSVLEELVRDIAVLYCLIYISGASTSGVRYTDLKSAGANYVGENRLYNSIMADVEKNLSSYISRNNDAFLIGGFS